MGLTAETVAKKWNISREDQDALAVESHRRAIDAIKHCVFQERSWVFWSIQKSRGTIPPGN